MCRGFLERFVGGVVTFLRKFVSFGYLGYELFRLVKDCFGVKDGEVRGG